MPTLPAPLADRVLIVGDSHMCKTPFGPRLIKDLAEGGKNSVVVFCSPGTSVQHWLNGFKPTNPVNRCETYTAENTGSPVFCANGTGNLPQIRQLLDDEKPDRAVIALGTNNLGLNALGAFAPFARIVKGSGAICEWVGPPAMGTNTPTCNDYGHNLDTLVQDIKTSVGQLCEYIDSREWTTPDSSPGCPHRYGQDAIQWADGVFGAVVPGP